MPYNLIPMGPGVAIGVSIGVGLLIYIGTLWQSLRRARRTRRPWIVSQLRETGGSVEVPANYAGETRR